MKLIEKKQYVTGIRDSRTAISRRIESLIFPRKSFQKKGEYKQKKSIQKRDFRSGETTGVGCFVDNVLRRSRQCCECSSLRTKKKMRKENTKK